MREPDVASRRGFVAALESCPQEVVRPALHAAMSSQPAPSGRQQIALLKLAACRSGLDLEVAHLILALPPEASDTGARKAAEGFLNRKPKDTGRRLARTLYGT
jgi:hypothetical protein